MIIHVDSDIYITNKYFSPVEESMPKNQLIEALIKSKISN